MQTVSKRGPLFVLLLLLGACGGNAARPDGGGSGGSSGTGGHQGTGGSAGSGGAGQGTGGEAASGGAVGTGGAAHSGGQGGPGGGQGGTAGQGQQGGAAGATGGRGGAQGGQGGGQGGQSGNVCAAAVEQGACTGEGTLCSFGCTDACHFCNMLRCQGGHWIRQEAAPAPCFACGPTLLCQKNAQYCHQMTGGPVGSTTSYQCRATPTSCLPAPTCACLKTAAVTGADLCTQAAAGELTVMVPLP